MKTFRITNIYIYALRKVRVTGRLYRHTYSSLFGYTISPACLYGLATARDTYPPDRVPCWGTGILPGGAGNAQYAFSLRKSPSTSVGAGAEGRRGEGLYGRPLPGHDTRSYSIACPLLKQGLRGHTCPPGRIPSKPLQNDARALRVVSFLNDTAHLAVQLVWFGCAGQVLL
jgi:hypothetical protein